MMIKKIKRYIDNYKYKKLTPKNRRHDDIYLVSYPKSGNTWVSFLISNVINEYLELGIDINFNTVRDFVPDIHMSRDVPVNMNLSPFKRIMKSHTSYNPYYQTIFLLVREPKDVMVSYYKYSTKLKQFDGDLTNFIHNNSYGIKKWCLHTDSWLKKVKHSQRLYILTYEDLQKDTFNTLKQLFLIMGFELDDSLIKKAVEKSDISKMKKIEEYSKGYSLSKFENFKFVRKGKTGEGNKLLSEKDKNIIEDESKEMMEIINENSIYNNIYKGSNL
jgi:hypothetical protein